MEYKKNITRVIELLKKEIGETRAVVADKNPFKVLVATILSQRTRDENTAKASRALFKLARTPNGILNLSVKKIEQAIKPAGFYRNKAKILLKLCRVLLDKYNGGVPCFMEELVKLPGVGEKTAGCVVVYGFGKPEIPVDVHVARVSLRLGWVRVKKPERVRKELMRILPKRYWLAVNDLMVKHGQRICRSRPKCNVCYLKSYCWWYNRHEGSGGVAGSLS